MAGSAPAASLPGITASASQPVSQPGHGNVRDQGFQGPLQKSGTNKVLQAMWLSCQFHEWIILRINIKLH